MNGAGKDIDFVQNIFLDPDVVLEIVEQIEKEK